MPDRPVTFHWRDYRDDNKNKLMTIDASEFIRRFLLHILPPRFVKIRYYGILSNRNHREKLKICRSYLEAPNDQQQQPAKNIGWQDLFLSITGIDFRICLVCGKGKMKTQEILNPIEKSFLKRLMLLNRFVCFLTYHGNFAIESP
ncbi:MAG: transposase [Firmicutes bacterium]|nr:transposase [Bacillota bacterium]